MDQIERACRLLASAYDVGPMFEAVGTIVPAPDEGGGDAGDGALTGATLPICARSETLELAGRAVHWDRSKWPKWVHNLAADQRREVLQWSESASFRMRGRGVEYKVGEHIHWRRSLGTVLQPATRPVRAALIALVEANLTGPLEALLLLAATQRAELWAIVRRYAIACGHPDWAADEAARRLVIKAEPLRDRAKVVRRKAEVFQREVRSAQCRLEDWLTRAASEFMAVYEKPAPIEINHGQPSGTVSDSMWHPERLGLDDNGCEISGIQKRVPKGVIGREGLPPGTQTRRPPSDMGGDFDQFTEAA